MCISARNNARLLPGATGISLALAVASCTVGPDFTPPGAPSVTHYTSGEDPARTAVADGAAQQFKAEAGLPADWWRLFASKALDDAVRQGLAASPTIAAAEANLRQARDELRAGEGVFYPQIDGGLSATRERPSANATPLKFNEGIYNLFTLSTSVSYTLDLFGGEHRTVEALGAVADYQQNAARAAALTLASNIANTMIAASAYDAEIAATAEIVERQKAQVRLATVQADAGTATYAAMLSLETQLEATEATLPPLRQKRIQAQDLLAVLEEKLPAEWQPPHVEFADLSLPHELPISLPSALVHQRPDILQAEASFHQASAEVGVATAALLPSVTLDGAFGASDTSTTGLLSAGSKLWSVGAGVTQPIFRGGTLWFQRKGAIDAYDASAASYRQTVLGAFEQVADTLRALEHDADELAIEARALDTASRALNLVQANYAAGLATYSDVLIADAQYLEARIADIEARATRYQDTVALFVALGGGWWNENEAVEAAAIDPVTRPGAASAP